MKNEIINLALKQVESEDKNELIASNPFFKEYIEVFNENTLFNECVIRNTTLINKSDVLRISNMLIEAFKITVNKLLKFNLVVNAGLIIFIVDGTVDAHGIIAEGLATYMSMNLIKISIINYFVF